MAAQSSCSLAESLALLPSAERVAALAGLTESQANELLWDWGFWGRADQFAPGSPNSPNIRSDWAYWLVLAGRGWGKTRTGAEWIRRKKDHCGRIALIGPTTAAARDVMVEGPTGIMACSPPWDRPKYEPSLRRVTWDNGAIAITYSAEEPERLRGPQHGAGWLDELAASEYAQEVWDQFKFGLRVGENPQALITTTPKPIPVIREITSDPMSVVTRGSTYENKSNLPEKFYRDILRKYEGTRLGRQELLAEILEDTPGALWTRAMIDAARIEDRLMPQMVRIVVAIDPAVTAGENSDETGMVVAGVAYGQGGTPHGFVLEDASGRMSPAEWGARAVDLLRKWRAERIVGEVNNGGDLVEANIRNAPGGAAVPYRAVRASRGKRTRAEPVSALYEQRRVHHIRRHLSPGEQPLTALEDQMCTWVPGDRSPDRMDALVWALWDLIIEPEEMAITTQIGQYYEISPV